MPHTLRAVPHCRPRLLAALACLALTGQGTGDRVGVGQPCPEMEFKSMVRGDGRVRLSEFRGQPVLLALYSTVFAGMEGARGAVKLHEEYGEDGLVVLLMEAKDHDETFVEALVLKTLPGSRCPLLKGQRLPFEWDRDIGPPPWVALVGIDGTVLYAGSYQGLRKVEKLVESELKRAREGWGTGPEARAIRGLAFGEDSLGAARLRLDELSSEFPLEQSADGELFLVAHEVDTLYATRKRSVAHLVEHGQPTEGLERARALVEATEGYAEWNDEARALLAGLETPEARAERALEDDLERILRPLASKSPRKGLSNKLLRFAKDAGDSGSGRRARRIAAAVDLALAGLEQD